MTPNEGCRMLFLSRLSLPYSIYLSALLQRLLTLVAINTFPTACPCSLSWERVSHEGGPRGAPPVPAAVGSTLQLCWGSFLFAALVSRSLPAPSSSVAVLLHALQARSSQHSVLFLTLHMLIPGCPLSLTWFHLPGKGLALAVLWLFFFGP